MKKKFIYWAVLVVLIFVLAYFIFSSSMFDNLKNKASLAEINDTIALSDVRNYVNNNISRCPLI